MARTLNNFNDILKPRREEMSTFMWVSRELNTLVANKQFVRPTPKQHKLEVLHSSNIQEILRKLAVQQNVPIAELEEQVCLILDEIGFNKQLCVIRWLAVILTKICLKVCSGINVNKDSIIQLKSVMGNTPVIFIPSHRSYADFILMSFMCFTYDIEIPAIAAGMDFHGMFGMGSVLRDTGAFFMRRSFNEDSLYWSTFRQYIRQLVVRGEIAIEFFIEGTRSRSGKSLTPKLGLLSMILKAFFLSEVPDILFVPINISYDRVMEERLFAFELLGVPKPKESTSAFFKSLSLINEKYGNIYFDFGEPISAKSFFGNKIDRTQHNMKAAHAQEATEAEKKMSVSLAYEIVRRQQQLSIITTFNLVAVILISGIMSDENVSTLSKLFTGVAWLKKVIEVFGGLTDVRNLQNDVLDCFDVHKNLVQVDHESKLKLVRNEIVVGNLDTAKLKGHSLSQETMNLAVPFIMLQLYVNPVMHILVNPAILITVLKNVSMDKDSLFEHYSFLRNLLSYEFVTDGRRLYLDFEESIEKCMELNILVFTDKQFIAGNNKKLQIVLWNLLNPFLITYHTVCQVLCNIAIKNGSSEKCILEAVQCKIEQLLTAKQHFNPYSLNLDSAANCLLSLTSRSAVTKEKLNNSISYKANVNALRAIIYKIDTYLPGINSFNVKPVHFSSKL